MKSLQQALVGMFNIYLIFSANIIQVLCSDRPTALKSVDDSLTTVNDVIEVARVQQVQKQHFNEASKLSDRQLFVEDSFTPSKQLTTHFGSKLSGSTLEDDHTAADVTSRREHEDQIADQHQQRLVIKRRIKAPHRQVNSDVEYRRRSQGASKGYRRPASNYRQRLRAQPFSYTDYDDNYPNYLQRIYDYERQEALGHYSDVLSRYSGSDPNTDGRVPDSYVRTPYRTALADVQSNNIPHRRRYSTFNSPARLDQEGSVRFPFERPQPQSSVLAADTPSTDSGSGLLGTILSLLKKPAKQSSQSADLTNEPSYEFVYNNLDYGDKSSDTDTFVPTLDDYEDFNINFVDEQESTTQQYDFRDVLHSIRDNETRVETLKKFLSAASSLTDRASTDPSYMLFNMPITLLSILGGFYALSAVAVLSYKYTLLATGNSNGAAVAILPVVFSFLVPLLVVTIYLVARASLDGQINLGQLARGDFERVVRPDFEPLDFAYDAAVGSTAVLGLGWIVSVIL